MLCQSDRVSDRGLPLNTFRRYTNLDPDDIDIFGIRGVGTKGAPVPPFGYFYQDAKKLIARLQEAYIPAMARGLAEAGARVVLNGRDEDKLANAAERLRAEGASIATLPFDVTDHDAARRAVRRRRRGR